MTATTIYLPGDQPTPDLAEAMRRDLALRGIRTLDRIRREHPQQPEPVAGCSSSI